MAMYHGNIVLGVPDSSAPRFHDIAHTDATAFVSSCPACGDTGEVGAHSYIKRDSAMPTHPCALCSLDSQMVH
jgi:hypothetical protein